jgi:hypothetical protein
MTSVNTLGKSAWRQESNGHQQAKECGSAQSRQCDHRVSPFVSTRVQGPLFSPSSLVSVAGHRLHRFVSLFGHVESGDTLLLTIGHDLLRWQTRQGVTGAGIAKNGRVRECIACIASSKSSKDAFQPSVNTRRGARRPRIGEPGTASDRLGCDHASVGPRRPATGASKPSWHNPIHAIILHPFTRIWGHTVFSCQNPR